MKKGTIVNCIKTEGCKSIGEVKSKTKAGTGCGGCLPLVQSIFNSEMRAAGNEITNSLCPHFTYSRADLYNIIRVKQLKSLPEHFLLQLPPDLTEHAPEPFKLSLMNFRLQNNIPTTAKKDNKRGQKGYVGWTPSTQIQQ